MSKWQAGTKFAAHHTVNHGKKQFALNDVHINTSEGFAAMLERAQFGVFHWTSKHLLQRYVDEMVFRWNMRCRYQDEAKCGHKKPFIGPLKTLLSRAVGRQLRRTPEWGLAWPAPIGPGYPPPPAS
ncbi:transposase [Magnetovibrio blakemorei]|uniref:transposase n=1 Tax=Magnetovibrio blakemorei TaxID=28181 RepID=UPI0009FB9A9A|nr:transposase [Magnetovibrio blakemorei]